MDEIDWLITHSPDEVILMHTVDMYPVDNPMLFTLELLKGTFLTQTIGYSDTTKDIKVCVGAVREFGTCIIEKGLKLDDECPGELTAVLPGEFMEMVEETR